MNIKHTLIPVTALSICLSTAVWADSDDNRERNSNRQSDEYSTRGKDRAEERHEMKKQHKKYNLPRVKTKTLIKEINELARGQRRLIATMSHNLAHYEFWERIGNELEEFEELTGVKIYFKRRKR